MSMTVQGYSASESDPKSVRRTGFTRSYRWNILLSSDSKEETKVIQVEENFIKTGDEILYKFNKFYY